MLEDKHWSNMAAAHASGLSTSARSHYFNSLEGPARQQYFDKISLLDGVDPYIQGTVV